MIRHWKQMLAVAAIGTAATLSATPAMARVGVSIGIGLPGVAVGASFGGRGYGGFGVVLPAPVYAAPVSYAPAVSYAPYPAYRAYSPYYYPAPAVYAPRAYVAPRVYSPHYRPVVRGLAYYPRVTYRPGSGHPPGWNNPRGPRGGYGPMAPGRGNGRGPN